MNSIVTTNRVFADRQKRISRTCECYDDFETGCCTIFTCQLSEWCDRGFKSKEKSVK